MGCGVDCKECMGAGREGKFENGEEDGAAELEGQFQRAADDVDVDEGDAEELFVLLEGAAELIEVMDKGGKGFE